MAKQNHPISIGRNIEKVRKLKQIKQETLAEALNVSRQYISKLEQMDEVEDEKLGAIAKALGVTPELIKSYNDEMTFNYIQNNYEGSSDNYSGLHSCNFNPLEKLLEVVEENKALYQQIIATEREKNALLEAMLNIKR